MYDYTKEEKKYKKAKNRYAEANRNRALYEKYLTRYIGYNEQGIIGDEKRLSWIEELQKVNKNLNLPSMHYEISPRIETKLDGIKNKNKNVKIYSSTMYLEAGLLHEGDFVNLLDTLRNDAKGIFKITKCDLRSKVSGKGVRISPRRPNMGIECNLDWHTVILGSKS